MRRSSSKKKRALRYYLQKAQGAADEETKIIAILKEEDRTKFKHDIALAPRWIG